MANTDQNQAAQLRDLADQVDYLCSCADFNSRPSTGVRAKVDEFLNSGDQKGAFDFLKRVQARFSALSEKGALDNETNAAMRSRLGISMFSWLMSDDDDNVGPVQEAIDALMALSASGPASVEEEVRLRLGISKERWEQHAG